MPQTEGRRSGRSGDEENEDCAEDTSQKSFWRGFYSASVLRASISGAYTLSSTDFTHRVGIVLAFTVPRVPGFQINQDNPLTNATGAFNKSIPVEFPRAPTNFSFPALADLQIDTSSNFLPLKFNSLHADVFDLQTSRQVGSGDLGSMTFPAKQFTQISIPLNFSFIATNDSDMTCTDNLSCPSYGSNAYAGNNWYNACRNSAFAPSGKRPR